MVHCFYTHTLSITSKGHDIFWSTITSAILAITQILIFTINGFSYGGGLMPNFVTRALVQVRTWVTRIWTGLLSAQVDLESWSQQPKVDWACLMMHTHTQRDSEQRCSCVSPVKKISPPLIFLCKNILHPQSWSHKKSPPFNNFI